MYPFYYSERPEQSVGQSQGITVSNSYSHGWRNTVLCFTVRKNRMDNLLSVRPQFYCNTITVRRRNCSHSSGVSNVS